jgi:hypothetical protein
MDGSKVKGCIYNNAEWFVNNFESDKLIKHDTDELHIFIGGNRTTMRIYMRILTFR